jgi:hypothetical protein
MKSSEKSTIDETTLMYPLRTSKGKVIEFNELPAAKYSKKTAPVSATIQFDFEGNYKSFTRVIPYNALCNAVGAEVYKDDIIRLDVCFDGKKYHNVYSIDN